MPLILEAGRSEFQVSLDSTVNSRLGRVTERKERKGKDRKMQWRQKQKVAYRTLWCRRQLEKIRRFGGSELPNTAKEGDWNKGLEKWLTSVMLC